ASGSSGNCYVVRSRSTALLVDAGISARRIRTGLAGLELDASSLAGVLVTHEHSDHISGLKTLTRTGDIKIYANEETFRGMRFQLPEDRCCRFSTGDTFQVGDMDIRTFAVSHDTADPVGYSLSFEGRRITIVTDTGAVTQPLMAEIREADILVLESNHDESILRMGHYPWFLKQRILGEQGHLSNEAAARALAAVLQEEQCRGQKKLRRVLLAHLSRENNFPEMAMATMENILEESGCPAGNETQLITLSRTEVSPIYSV
ncbi:MAG TPA: MBL fold metallo-hydrolase, partial [Clostridiales bacterium]|nr:MBL fold metallo-hydrolase [Clostridiales bacterium]